MRAIVFAGATVAMLSASLQAHAANTGTIEGTATTQGGLPLNGMCGVLYDAKATTQLLAFAGTGTDGMAGHYIQTNVPAGRYVLFFVNCGANTGGNPDFNYTPIFFGSTWDAAMATKVVVSGGQTTSLGPQAVPLGGTVTGTIIDKTINMPADSPPVIMVPPGGKKFFLSFSWTLVCANGSGMYTTNSDFMQGVPNGAKAYFAPPGWGCTNSQGVYNAGFFKPSKSKAISITQDGTTTVNGTVRESGH